MRWKRASDLEQLSQRRPVLVLVAFAAASAVACGALAADARTEGQAAADLARGYWDQFHDVRVVFHVEQVRPTNEVMRSGAVWTWRVDDTAGSLDVPIPSTLDGPDPLRLRRYMLLGVCRELDYVPRVDGVFEPRGMVRHDPAVMLREPYSPLTFHENLVFGHWHAVLREAERFHFALLAEDETARPGVSVQDPTATFRVESRLDPVLGLLPVEQTTTATGQSWLMRYQVEDAQEVAAGLWYPRIMRTFYDTGEAVYETVYTFSQVEINSFPPDSAFTFEFPVGAKIQNQITGAVYFVEEAAGDSGTSASMGSGVQLTDPEQSEVVVTHLERSIGLARAFGPRDGRPAATFAAYADKPRGMSAGATLGWGALGAVVAVGLGGGMTFLVRRRSRRSRPPVSS